MTQVAAFHREPVPTAKPSTATTLGDLRFRSLLADDAWQALPPAIRKRFSKRLGPGASAVYVGEVVETSMSAAGWLLAQACRCVGSPLPTERGAGAASVVTVTEDGGSGGQNWTRLYARRSGFPQIIHSAKRFAGPTGLEEHVGGGLGMSLVVSVEGAALVFRSREYFIGVFGRRLKLPGWLTPGDLTVTHAETEAGSFAFGLSIHHPWFGPLIRQVAVFHDSDTARPPAAWPLTEETT